MLCNSLELGCDCLGEIRYFDGVVNNNDGGPLTITNAICLHEEDYGILWKHVDFRTMDTEVRRSRRLVLSTIATVGNYEYGYFWYFYQDGTIGYEIKMTGVMSNGAIADGVKPKFGAMVAPGVYGPNHQHFFSLRLDMMVDGLENTVYECDSEALPPGPENPHGNAWVVKAKPLKRESEAQSIINPLAARYWKIANPNQLNGVGEPVAYKLMPGDNVLPFYQPDANAIQRAGFTTKHLWVTAYDPEPAPRWRRSARVREGRPQGREHRRGRLVHDGRSSPGPTRGVAGDAGGLHRLPPEAPGFLRRQPGTRRAGAPQRSRGARALATLQIKAGG
jgi:primary-amine oxidase